MNQLNTIKGNVRIGIVEFFIKCTMAAAKMAVMAAPTKAMIHLVDPVKNNVRAIPVNTELYPYRPVFTLSSFAPPTFAIRVPMKEDKRAINPKYQDEMEMAIRIMTPDTTFSMNMT